MPKKVKEIDGTCVDCKRETKVFKIIRPNEPEIYSWICGNCYMIRLTKLYWED